MLKSVFLFVTRTSTFVLRAGGVKMIAEGCYKAATVVVIALVEPYLVVVDMVAVATAVEQVFACESDAETIMPECFDYAHIEYCLLVAHVDILVVAAALIAEVQFSGQVGADSKGVVQLEHYDGLVQMDGLRETLHREPRLDKSQCE